MKVVSIVGARPQFIKSAAVIPPLKKENEIIIVHTGQHYDYEMSKIHFNTFKLEKPNYNLEVGSGTHAEQTSKIMLKLEKILLREKPDLVITYGDTNSTVASTITAAKLFIPVAHVEAGLRLKKLLTPEEINRRIVDSVSSLLFPPTLIAKNNLIAEGHHDDTFLCGDVMADILLAAKKRGFNFSEIEKSYQVKKFNYYLLTIHRPINTDKINNLLKIIKTLSKSKETIIFPIHPRTKKVFNKLGGAKLGDYTNIVFINPVDYNTFISLENYSKKIITDSGGVQKEAYILRKPCITLMDWTCWPETLKDNLNILVGSDPKKIIKAMQQKIIPNTTEIIFGSGNAGNNITKCIEQFFHEGEL